MRVNGKKLVRPSRALLQAQADRDFYKAKCRRLERELVMERVKTAALGARLAAGYDGAE